MLTDTIKFNMDSFEKDLQEWQRRFKQDPKDRWFVHYTIMSEKIKEKAKINILPTIHTLQDLKYTYGEKYKVKDIEYHLETALNACEVIRKTLREIYDLYKIQKEYETIRMSWQAHFPTLFKRINNVRERVYILDRILVNEEEL